MLNYIPMLQHMFLTYTLRGLLLGESSCRLMQPNVCRTQTPDGKRLQEHPLALVGYHKKSVAIPAAEIGRRYH